MPGKPDVKLVIKKPIKTGPNSTYWAPIGDLALWADEKTGEYSGNVRIFALGEFKCFFDKPFTPEQKKAYRGESNEPEQHPFGDE